jgi:cyclase
MLMVRIIPCLDTHDGKVVKGIRFGNLRDAGSPVELAARYEKQGADEIVVLDISATLEARENRLQTVRELREVLSIPLTVGGGVRSLQHCEDLLNAGADKVSINSAAFRDPELLSRVAERFGSQCTVVAIDAVRTSSDKQGEALSWAVAIDSGRSKMDFTATEWAREAVNRGAGEILLTSWDKDGTRSGYDVELIRAVAAVVDVPIIASGGAARPSDFAHAYEAGASALLAASIFHDGEYTVMNVKQSLSEAGIPVRL